VNGLVIVFSLNELAGRAQFRATARLGSFLEPRAK
jgi:hypothetical protein